MNELDKNQTLTLIKKSNINSSTVEYNQNYFTINIQGELMKKEEPVISLKSIYELMINKFESIENRLDKHDQEFKKINDRLDKHDQEFKKINYRLDNIENDMTVIKKLPTISKELNKLI